MPASCPNTKSYEQLLLGSLPPPESERLLGHLETCPSCSQTLDQLLESETLVGAVRMQPAREQPKPEAEVVDGLMQRLADMPSALRRNSSSGAALDKAIEYAELAAD